MAGVTNVNKLHTKKWSILFRFYSPLTIIYSGERERDGDNAQRSGGQTRQVSVDDIKSNCPEIDKEVAPGNRPIHFKMERNDE